MNKREIFRNWKVSVKPYASNKEAYENFTEDTDFITDLNINSTNLDIILDVEDAFQIHIDNESMEKWWMSSPLYLLYRD
jgi:acyl carrier protein